MYRLRTQLNYQTAILHEIPRSYKLSEKEEVELIKHLVKEAQTRKEITPEIDHQTKQLQKYMKANLRRKLRPWLNELPNH